MMKVKPILYLFVLLSGMLGATVSQAALEWRIPQKLTLDTPPLDVAVSLNGKRVFVLTEKGEIQIHTPAGKLIGKIAVGNHVDRIRVGPRDDLLLLVSHNNSSVETLVIDFIQELETSGAPFKGPEGAPVSIVVFSDFQ